MGFSPSCRAGTKISLDFLGFLYRKSSIQRISNALKILCLSFCPIFCLLFALICRILSLIVRKNSAKNPSHKNSKALEMRCTCTIFLFVYSTNEAVVIEKRHYLLVIFQGINVYSASLMD